MPGSFVRQDQYGFMAHFYVVSQYVLPVLAWGFLGPDEELRRVCEYFKVKFMRKCLLARNSEPRTVTYYVSHKYRRQLPKPFDKHA